jgi:hypothetical protein
VKWYGVIGYASTEEVRPGVYKEQFTERNYYGEVNRYSRRLRTADKVVDDFEISNEISIVADPFAVQHFHEMRYIEFMGAKWKISEANIQYPRLNLTLGGVYNAEQA